MALLGPANATREHVERLLMRVREDLATMPILHFRQEHRDLMDQT